MKDIHQHKIHFDSDTNTLKLTAKIPLGLKYLRSIAVIDEQFILLGNDREFGLFNPEQQEYIWQTKNISDAGVKSIIELEDEILVQCDHTRIYFLDKKDGEIKTTIKGGFGSNPFVFNNHVFFEGTKALVKVNPEKPSKKIKIHHPETDVKKLQELNWNNHQHVIQENRFWQIYSHNKGAFILGIDISEEKETIRIDLEESFKKEKSLLGFDLYKNTFYCMTKSHIIGVDKKTGKTRTKLPFFPDLNEKDIVDSRIRAKGMVIHNDQLIFSINLLNTRTYTGCISLKSKKPIIQKLIDERIYNKQYLWSLSSPSLSESHFFKGQKDLYGFGHNNIFKISNNQLTAIRLEDDDKVFRCMEHTPRNLVVLNKKLYCVYEYRNEHSDFEHGLLCFE